MGLKMHSCSVLFWSGCNLYNLMTDGFPKQTSEQTQGQMHCKGDFVHKNKLECTVV